MDASTDPSTDALFEAVLDGEVKSVLGAWDREDPETIRDGVEKEDGRFIDGWQGGLRGRV